jgi:alpha-ketoglutarate-dependent taurine dioxygenase
METASKMQSQPLTATRRKINPTSLSDYVTIDRSWENRSLPVCISPAVESLNLSAWARDATPVLEQILRKEGAVLLRDFAAGGQPAFEEFIHAIQMERMHYMEGATPRKPLGKDIYTSTEFPADHAIALHNELSYVVTWPMKICFFCVVAPTDRGETPIGDMRKVLQRLNPEVRDRFERKGWMLQRNFSEHLGLPWQTSFHVSTKAEFESYCDQAKVQFEWRDENHVRTRQVRPAIATHPKTGEKVWHNHAAFWHVSSLDKTVREILVSEYGEEGLPYNTFYGDGTPIEEEVIAHLNEIITAETVKFRWKEGDLLLMDNMLIAHGRSPFSGPRQIIVSMGEPYTRTDMLPIQPQ